MAKNAEAKVKQNKSATTRNGVGVFRVEPSMEARTRNQGPGPTCTEKKSQLRLQSNPIC